MKIYRDLNAPPAELRAGAVAIGNFDGVHRGHARIVERLVAAARTVGGPAVVFTFDPHPVRVLRPAQAPPPLTWTDRKAELLGELGIDAMVAYPTDEALLRFSPREFFDKIIRKRLDAKALVEGPNFFFGRARQGTINVLRTFCESDGLALEVVEPVVIDGQPVSSSRVRGLLAGGQVEQAVALLTRPYRIGGMVTHGAGRGATLGFPTANIDGIDTLLPGLGVYVGTAHTGTGNWPAAINVGPNPTFGEQAVKVEAHLIGFAESLYGQRLEVDFLRRLRDIRQFGGVEDLKAQLQRDVTEASDLMSGANQANT